MSLSTLAFEVTDVDAYFEVISVVFVTCCYILFCYTCSCYILLTYGVIVLHVMLLTYCFCFNLVSLLIISINNMSYVQRRYCIFGCDSTAVRGAPYHRFPNPEKQPQLFAAWVSAAGDHLRERDPKRIRNKRICDHHFDPSIKTAGGRLFWSAIPTINLHRVKQSISTIVEADHSYSRPRREFAQPLADIANLPGPSSANNTTTFPVPSGSSAMTCLTVAENNSPQIKRTRFDAGVNQSFSTIVEADYSYSRPRREFSQPLADITNLPGPSSANITTTFPVPSGSSAMTCLTVAEKNSPQIKRTRFDADQTFQYLLNKKEKLQAKKTRQNQNEIRRLRRKVKNYHTRVLRLRRQQKLSTKRDFDKLTQKMSVAAKLFTRMQAYESHKKKHGRRFTQDEKILSLTIFKKSPKAYKLMCKHFTLPSTKILKQMLAKIKLTTGINSVVFKELKATVSKMMLQDRLCTLIFDEMSISPQIQYNVHTDDLVGFENYGNDQKTDKFANHVLVFMVKGITKNFKQPVAYYFVQALKTQKLKEILNDVVSNILATGLTIVATVCDQSSVNVSTINNLVAEAKKVYFQAGKEWRKDIMIISNTEIIPLYDPPHLIKGIRNNLLNKEMVYFHENSLKTIKWEDFQLVYEADRSHGELRLLPKLTHEHIDPHKIKKMRVKNAVQVLSFSMAVATDNLVARGNVPKKCESLVPFVLLIDKLFDTLNASTFYAQNGKIYRAAVKPNSPHHKLWQDALKMLKSIKYLASNCAVEKTVPTVINLIKTIEGFKSLWQLVHKKYELDALLTRNVNQDPLENFFGSIRSLGARNVMPNCFNFESAYKTLLLNNFTSNHALNSNCEEDSNKSLQSLAFLINSKDENVTAPSLAQNIVIDQPLDVIQNETDKCASGADQRIYVCGWALSKCLQNVVKGCSNCKNTLLGNSENDMYQYIHKKEYIINKKCLCYPSESLVACFQDIQNLTIAFLNNECHKKNIKERIKSFVILFVDFNFLSCEIHQHDVKECFLDTSINIIIYSWCRSINRILEGKLTYDGEDVTKKAAQAYFNKHKTYKK